MKHRFGQPTKRVGRSFLSRMLDGTSVITCKILTVDEPPQLEQQPKASAEIRAHVADCREMRSATSSSDPLSRSHRKRRPRLCCTDSRRGSSRPRDHQLRVRSQRSLQRAETDGKLTLGLSNVYTIEERALGAQERGYGAHRRDGETRKGKVSSSGNSTHESTGGR